MAKAVGIAVSSVQKIWQAHGLKPHLVRSFKPDLDSAFRNVVSGEEVTAAVPAVCTTSSRKG
jgi:hypothetical protein